MGWNQGVAVPVNSSGGYPFFFPSLFGSGADGDLTATNQSDVGHLGSFGTKQYNNLIIPAGVTWTIATGTSSGAAIISGKKKITIAGSIIGSGANGTAGAGGTAGSGGSQAGGGVGATGSSFAPNTSGPGTGGTKATKYGHGALDRVSAGDQTRGGGSGAGATSLANPGNLSGGLGGATFKFDVGTSYATKYGVAGRVVTASNPLRQTLVLPMDATILGVPTGAATTGTRPSGSDYGPWANAANTGWLPLDHLSPAPSGCGGAIDGALGNCYGGGGGGGAGVLVLEAETIELQAGYAITFNGGNGGNSAAGANGAMGGAPGWGGIVLLICRNLIGSTASISVNAGSLGTNAGTGVNNLAGVAGSLYVIRV